MNFVLFSCTLLAIIVVAHGGFDHSVELSAYDGFGAGYYNRVPLAKDGTPLDTDHVAAAKAAHNAAYALDRARHIAYAHGYATAEHDAPVDTAEVQFARFQHKAAHEQARQLIHNPALAKSLLPVDAPEVQIAKQEHLAAAEHVRYRNAYTAYEHGQHAAGHNYH